MPSQILLLHLKIEYFVSHSLFEVTGNRSKSDDPLHIYIGMFNLHFRSVNKRNINKSSIFDVIIDQARHYCNMPIITISTYSGRTKDRKID
jgi:hypothetical protein